MKKSAKPAYGPEVNRFRPLSNRILVEPDAVEEVTKGGIIIPGNAKEKPTQGTVVRKGPGFSDQKMETNIGDRVLFHKFAGAEVTLDEKEYYVMRETDVFATLPE